MKKLTKKQKKQIEQIVAPIIVVLVILSFFALYYLVKVYMPAKEAAPGPSPEVGLVTCEDLGCPEGSQFIGSSQSNVYHECDSFYAETILPENRVCFYSATEAEEAGYRPAAK